MLKLLYGSLRKYDPASDKDVLLRSDMPSDPNDPARLNEDDANSKSHEDNAFN